MSKDTESMTEDLTKLKEVVEFLTRPELKTRLIKRLDHFIENLKTIRDRLNDAALEDKSLCVGRSIDDILAFIESAKTDENLMTLLFPLVNKGKLKRAKAPRKIPDNLTNQEIRELIKGDLSKSELKLIAAQRSIPFGKGNFEVIKQNIIKNLDRQESYQRLGGM